MVSVGRDTSEPLADACLLGGLPTYRHRRYALAAALICYAVFTNEPVLVLPVVLALTRLWQMGRRQARPGPLISCVCWVTLAPVRSLLVGQGGTGDGRDADELL
ncbi:MAG: hypothetical protein ACRDNO_06850 [Trebonia sp.]